MRRACLKCDTSHELKLTRGAVQTEGLDWPSGVLMRAASACALSRASARSGVRLFSDVSSSAAAQLRRRPADGAAVLCGHTYTCAHALWDMSWKSSGARVQHGPILSSGRPPSQASFRERRGGKEALGWLGRPTLPAHHARAVQRRPALLTCLLHACARESTTHDALRSRTCPNSESGWHQGGAPPGDRERPVGPRNF